MPGILLDSTFCIACIRRKPWAIQALSSVPLNSVAVSSMGVRHLQQLSAEETHVLKRPGTIEKACIQEVLPWAPLTISPLMNSI